MKHTYMFRTAILVFFVTLIAGTGNLYADDGYDLWFKYSKIDDAQKLADYQAAISSVVVQGDSQTCQVIKDELKKGLSGLLSKDVSFDNAIDKAGTLVIGTPENSDIVKRLDLADSLKDQGNEGFIIKNTQVDGENCILIAANKDIGLLYGTFDFLRLIQTGEVINNLDITSKPRIQYRLLDHWDNAPRGNNAQGTIERGYAGRSLWKWNELPDTVDTRYADYARANASIGINGSVLNNVNANAIFFSTEYLKKVAKLADVFRPYGIKVYLSVRYSLPTQMATENGIGPLRTADPLDPTVQEWWKDKAQEIYKYIPDFGGFLVKANSEGQPGPQDYNRTHAEGANLLADAIAPYGGIVMWRAFVYDERVDPDRAKRAYMEFVPLDGKFKDNVFAQAKNGPIDFQPREPVQPLFGALKQTPVMLELQVTKEYLGWSTHLVYLAPMWKEYLEFDTYAKGKGSTMAKVIDGTLDNYKITGIAGVANTGSDRNWCGHIFLQSNWYSYGRLAWDHELTSDEIADEWIKMTLTHDSETVKTIKSMMLGSWEACINYQEPLGLHHIMDNSHYGPGPQISRAARIDWTPAYYHRADANGLGFDRSSTGSNFTSQYFSPLKEEFDDIETCPEKYLLWFHHVPWDYKMKSGRTLWDELCVKYYQGTDYVEQMAKTWQTLKDEIDPEIFEHVTAKLNQQIIDSARWRDTCIQYFQRYSDMPIPDSVKSN
ncbi:MAG: alpha-glucuronidase family glycosyl hydrolase [Sedimentisphaerales bacterium]